ncbi:MaoC/PaaZ C-terminal domain-containing protein [Chachezhania sediminis]|uniref:MaoC/PaaZ C-terminal domain-containing protein n=1 Tax=Chachezhania sediminis TaxID=2599291 RepID=UPI00131AA44F|nr:MaoC/PaaZ C-terminal domain-containing protein [Chachezhania sediminis]
MDLTQGARYRTEARTITETDIVGFAGLSGDFTPIHTDAEFARTTPYGERTAHGPLVLSVVIGLATRLGIFGERVIGLRNIGWDFSGGVRIGDTIHGEVEIAGIRPSSKPGRAVGTFAFRVLNQREETVQTGQMIVVLKDG